MRYWSARYWSDQYWSTRYWSQGSYSGTVASTLEAFPTAFISSSITGSYWYTKYWSASYWESHYWGVAIPSAANGTMAASLQDASAAFSASSTWTEYVDISVNVGLAWQITAFDVFTGTMAVTLADETTAFTGVTLPPNSETGIITSQLASAVPAFTGTFVAPASRTGIATITLADAAAFIQGITAAPASRIAALNVTLAETSATFRGTIGIPVFTGSMAVTLDAFTPSITGVTFTGYVDIGPLLGRTDDFTSLWQGSITTPEVFDPLEHGPENSEAIEFPSFYEICDRTGFRVPRGTLRREWSGAMVRPESWEARHPQDFVRGVPERQRGSPRPEQPDEFIEVEVTADDL